jgi:site-specific recombinase XerD
MWESMIRVSELIELNIDAIDPQKNFVQIVGKKNYKKRWIMWSPDTHQLLLTYIAKRKMLAPHEALFAHESAGVTNRMQTRSVERWMKVAREKAELTQPISCHALRHGGAHELVKKGASLKFLGLILGHSDSNPRAGMQYLRFSKEESLDVVDKFVGLRFDKLAPQPFPRTFSNYNMMEAAL